MQLDAIIEADPKGSGKRLFPNGGFDFMNEQAKCDFLRKRMIELREKNGKSQAEMAELIGCKELIAAIHEDPLFMSLISILQYLIDNPSCSVKVVKREVFRAISICNKLKARYAVSEGV